MIINLDSLKKRLDKNIEELICGNLKFLLTLTIKFAELILIQLLKVNIRYYFSFPFYTKKIDSKVIELEPLMIGVVDDVNYDTKIKAIKNNPNCIFMIKYPSKDMILTYLKNKNSLGWEFLLLNHEYLSDVHKKQNQIKN